MAYDYTLRPPLCRTGLFRGAISQSGGLSAKPLQSALATTAELAKRLNCSARTLCNALMTTEPAHACTAANVSADSIGLRLPELDHCGQAGMRVRMTVSAPSMLTRSFSLRHAAAARSSSAE